MDFHGVKIALLHDDTILVHLRDDKPGLFNANMWDCPGGGREGDESPSDCAIREVNEELEIKLDPEQIIWERWYPAQKDPSQKAVFMVARINQTDIDNVVLHEGQKWEMFQIERFLSDEQVVAHLQTRLKDYLHENT